MDVHKLEAAAAASGKASSNVALPRSNTTLIVKNLPFSTSQEDLRSLFSASGTIARFVLPPTKVLALVEFDAPASAQKAFRALAFKRYESVPIYLEWAPEGIFVQSDRSRHASPERKAEADDTDNESTGAASIIAMLITECMALFLLFLLQSLKCTPM